MKNNNTYLFSYLVPVLLAVMLGLSGLVLAADYDLVKDDSIDWKDLDAFAAEWLGDCNATNNWCNGANFDDDNNNIDFDDYTLLAKRWLTRPSLVGRWRFEEGSGSIANDSSSHDNDGTLNGDPNWVAGKEGSYALDFDADGDYVNVPDIDDSLDVDSNLTIAAWIRLNSIDAHNFIVTKQPSGTAGDAYPGNYEFKMHAPAGYLRLAHQTSTGSNLVYYESAAPVTAGDWEHVAVTLKSFNSVRFYIDGAPAGITAQTTAGGILNDEPVRIGVRKDMGKWFNGRMDDVRIYNRALSASEIADIVGTGGWATNPYPADEAFCMDKNVVLSWVPADDANSHDVYLGTDLSDVSDANNSWPVATGPGDPNIYKGNFDVNSFDPGGLEWDTVYYWRIDELDEANVPTKGPTWTFNTDTPAFPTAEGPGKWARGGRGGTVLFVTNLQDYNSVETPVAGSLRAAIDAAGPRTVVFNVSGTITLKDTLNVENDYITIAGQTAPGDGITLKDYGFRVAYADDVIVRYLRARPGDNVAHEPDSMSAYHANRVMFDHCSASWSVDETFSVTHCDDVTVQWCMISESLNLSTHADVSHGYASLIVGDYGKEVTYHHNLYAHHKTRSPRPENTNGSDMIGWIFDWRNNVIYSWLDSTPGYNSDAATVTLSNFVGNYYKDRPGDNTIHIYKEQCPSAKSYIEDNSLDEYNPADPWVLWRFDNLAFTEEKIAAYKQSEPFDAVPVATDDPNTAYARVIADAGACLPAVDSVDVRIIGDVVIGRGNIIDDEDEVGSWPTLYSLTALADNDSDGMPNYFEEQYSGILDPNILDHSGNADGDGYTNIEEYLNNTDPNGDDSTIVYVAASNSRAYEVNEVPGEFKVYRTGDTASPLTVNYTVSGDATAGTDYSTLSGSVTIAGGDSTATIDVTPIDDGSPDNAEQVIITIDPDANYNLGLPHRALVVILDED